MVAAASIAGEAVASIAVVGAIMAEAMATMAPLLSWVPVAGGMPTASASAGGDIGSIVVGSAGVGNKIKGVPDNRRAFSFWSIASFLANRVRREARALSLLPT
jgi:hypothetical protein